MIKEQRYFCQVAGSWAEPQAEGAIGRAAGNRQNAHGCRAGRRVAIKDAVMHDAETVDLATLK